MNLVDVEDDLLLQVSPTFFDRMRSRKATCDLIRNQSAGSGVDGAPNDTSYTEGSRSP